MIVPYEYMHEPDLIPLHRNFRRSVANEVELKGSGEINKPSDLYKSTIEWKSINTYTNENANLSQPNKSKIPSWSIPGNAHYSPRRMGNPINFMMLGKPGESPRDLLPPDAVVLPKNIHELKYF